MNSVQLLQVHSLNQMQQDMAIIIEVSGHGLGRGRGYRYGHDHGSENYTVRFKNQKRRKVK